MDERNDHSTKRYNKVSRALTIKKTTALMIFMSIGFFIVSAVFSNAINSISLNVSDFTDGFISQLTYIQSNFKLRDFDIWSLYNSHFIRWLIFYPMLFDSPVSDYSIYLLYTFPTLYALSRKSHFGLVFIFLLLPFGISLRSALAAIGLINVALYVIDPKRSLFYLLSGVVLCTLSSATILQALLLLVFFRLRKERKLKELLPFTILLYFFYIALVDKVGGALAGEIGYVSAGNTSNIVVGYIMRSTIVQSYNSGQARFYLYFVITIGIVVTVFWNVLKRTRDSQKKRHLLFSIFPGFLFEGLGVLAGAPIILWIMSPKFEKDNEL